MMRTNEHTGKTHNTRRGFTYPMTLKGFTLIELLVVVAIISILLGVLLPSLEMARGAAKNLQCISLCRQMMLGQASYAADNDNWFASVLSSGKAGITTNGVAFVGNKSPTTPTSIYDWFSPTLGDEFNFSANRAKRTQQIFDRFRCPEVINRNTELHPGSNGATTDVSDFRTLMNTPGQIFSQVSYLAPSTMHGVSLDRRTETGGAGSAGYEYVHSTPFKLPKSYQPRLDRVGAASKKVGVADGTRYFKYTRSRGGVGGVLDFDLDTKPQYFGSFTASSPLFDKSNEYGRTRETDRADLHIQLSMRHRGLAMNAGFWDGHAETLESKRVWREAELWYPTGSKYMGAEATPEAAARYTVGQEVQ